MRYSAAISNFLGRNEVRKILGPLLAGLGAFLLVMAILALAYAPDAVKKTPLEVDSTTYLTGEANRLDAGVRPIYALSITKSDDDASTDDVAVFTNVGCAVFDEGQDPQECADAEDENALALSTDVFATDRVSAEAVEFDALPEDAIPHEGLINKWPFDAEKKTYPYWDSVSKSGVEAVYDRTEEIDGLDTYVYRVTIDEAPIEIAEDTPGTYTDLKEVYVDPTTGKIIHQTDDQQRYLDDGTQVLDLQLAFTDDQQAENVADAEDSISGLDLITKTVPLVGFIGGGLLLLLGLFLVLTGRREAKRAA
jgi:Porin PorA